MEKEDPLTYFQLRNTPLREEMITLFVNHQGLAFSEAEINEMFSPAFDRVTVYRTIKTFLDKLIIHKVVCEKGVLKYAYNVASKAWPHPHFECTSCGKVLCLNGNGVAMIELPKGYQEEEVHTLVKGLCPDCSSGQ